MLKMLRCTAGDGDGAERNVDLAKVAEQAQHGHAAPVFKVGRHPDNDLTLDHPNFPLLISRRHADVFIENGQLCVKDCGSVNGTYINGRRLGSSDEVLCEGGRLSFGCTDTISRNGEPHRNPFVYIVTGVQSLLDSAKLANSSPAQECPPTQVAVSAEQVPVPQLASAGIELRQAIPAADRTSEALSEVTSAAHPAPHEAPGQHEAQDQPSASAAAAAAIMPTAADGGQHNPASVLAADVRTGPHTAAQQTSIAAAPVQPGSVGVMGSLVAMGSGRPMSPAQQLRQQQSPGLVDLTSAQELTSPAAAAQDDFVDLTKDDDDAPGQTPRRLYDILPGGSLVHEDRQRSIRKRKDFQDGQREGQAMREEGVKDIAGSSVGAAPAVAAEAADAAVSSSKGVLSKLESEFECVVCRELLVAAHSVIPCGHTFCGGCLMEWLVKNSTCPNCRVKVTSAPVPCLMIDSAVENMEKELLGPDDMEHRNARKAAWKESSKTAMARWQASFAARQNVFMPPPPGFAARHALPRRRSPRNGQQGGVGRLANVDAAFVALQGMGPRDMLIALGLSDESDEQRLQRGIQLARAHAQRTRTRAANEAAVPAMTGPPPRYHVEYGAASSCSLCTRVIRANSLRIRRDIYQTYHVDCFPSWGLVRSNWLHGLETLTPADQGHVQNLMRRR